MRHAFSGHTYQWQVGKWGEKVRVLGTGRQTRPTALGWWHGRATVVITARGRSCHTESERRVYTKPSAASTVLMRSLRRQLGQEAELGPCPAGTSNGSRQTGHVQSKTFISRLCPSSFCMRVAVWRLVDSAVVDNGAQSKLSTATR